METKYGQALFDFEPNYADELKVNAGELVQLLYELNQDWIYAKSLMVRCNDTQGILPKNFIRMVNIPEYLIDRNLKERTFIAIENFDFSETGDLEFKKDDIIISQNIVDENWHFGYCINDLARTGIFPLTHVAEIYLHSVSEEPQSKSPVKPAAFNKAVRRVLLRQAISLSSFEDCNSSQSGQNYLRFNKGDYILVTGELEDPDWLQGENLSGEKGIFPAKHIQYISSNF